EPPAPTLFSTTTGWPRRLASPSATTRPTMSVALPAENPTYILSGLEGKSSAACAPKGRENAVNASPTATANCFIFLCIIVSCRTLQSCDVSVFRFFLVMQEHGFAP